MDFGAIISRAINVTWENKVLWLFGFLITLAGGGAGYVRSNTQLTNQLTSAEMPWVEELSQIPSIILFAITALLCVLIIVAVILWVVAIIAKGGLIAGVQQIETEGKTTFRSAWRVGVNRFWRVLGLNLLIAIPIAAITFVFTFILVLMFGGALLSVIGMGTGEGSSESVMTGWLFAAIAVFCCMICISFVVGILVGALQVFGERAIVLENMSVPDSIRRAWQVFRANLGNIILLALMMLVISIIISIVLGLAVVALLLPTLLPAISEFMRSGTLSSGSVVVAVVGVLVASILGAVIETLYITFNSTTWTLAYRQFITLPALVAQPPATVQ